jgi:hypothetical protein
VERLLDGLVVDAEFLPDPATAKTESAKPRDFGRKPLVLMGVCLS